MPVRLIFLLAAVYNHFLLCVRLQCPPKGATIPYRPKGIPAGAHAVLAQQHSAQVSSQTGIIWLYILAILQNYNI